METDKTADAGQETNVSDEGRSGTGPWQRCLQSKQGEGELYCSDIVQHYTGRVLGYARVSTSRSRSLSLLFLCRNSDPWVSNADPWCFQADL